MALEKIKKAEIRTDADGHASLLCGENALKTTLREWRNAALFTQSLNKGIDVYENMVLYAVEDVEGLEKALEGYIRLNEIK